MAYTLEQLSDDIRTALKADPAVLDRYLGVAGAAAH